MITGFNTDIEYGGVTYHVQTEDKGKNRPIILSLVYDGGTVLASKRSPYDDLLSSHFNERILAERLNKQHRLICAAIQAGRIEDLKKMTAREAAARVSVENRADPPPVSPPVESLPVPERLAAESGVSKPAGVSLAEFTRSDNPIPKPFFEADEPFDDTGLVDEPIIEAVAVFDEDEIIIPAEAVEIIGGPEFERPDHNKLCIEILGDARFRGGERNSVAFMVCRGSSRKVVPGAEIMVKVLGSSFRPVIFHALTDTNGVATVNIQLPSFSTGRAAFLVRAISDGEEIELRRSIAHG
ncbi:MAG: hypothetical protein AB7F88_12280 [Pyrinomonadaceae bacterium]